MFFRKAKNQGLCLQVRLFSTEGVGFKAGSTSLPQLQHWLKVASPNFALPT